MLQPDKDVEEGLLINPLPLTTDPVDAEPLCENKRIPLPIEILKVMLQSIMGSWAEIWFTSKSQETGMVPAGSVPLPELASPNASVPVVVPVPDMDTQFMLASPPTELSEVVVQAPLEPVPEIWQASGVVAKLPEVATIDPALADGVAIASAASGTIASASREAF